MSKKIDSVFDANASLDEQSSMPALDDMIAVTQYAQILGDKDEGLTEEMKNLIRNESRFMRVAFHLLNNSVELRTKMGGITMKNVQTLAKEFADNEGDYKIRMLKDKAFEMLVDKDGINNKMVVPEAPWSEKK